MMNTDDTIYALATDWAESALAIVRTSGPHAISLCSRCFSRTKALIDAPSASLVHGYIVDPATSVRIDEVVAAVYRDGHGYTGEEAVEFTCHGSLPGLKRIWICSEPMDCVPLSRGIYVPGVRPWPVGSDAAEAVQELEAARSAASQSLALSRLDGALRRRIEELKQSTLDIVSFVEVQLDYAEDEIGGDTMFPRDSLRKTIAALDALAAT
jgi:tRNA modification GTPase